AFSFGKDRDDFGKERAKAFWSYRFLIGRPERQIFRHELILQPFGGEFDRLYLRSELLGLVAGRWGRARLQPDAHLAKRPNNLLAPGSANIVQRLDLFACQ